MKIALINPQTETDEMREIYAYHENLAIGLIGSVLRSNVFLVFVLCGI